MKNLLSITLFLLCSCIVAAQSLSDNVKSETVFPNEKELADLNRSLLLRFQREPILTTDGDLIPIQSPVLRVFQIAPSSSRWKMNFNYRPSIAYQANAPVIDGFTTPIVQNFVDAELSWKNLGFALQLETLRRNGYLFANSPAYIRMDSGALILPNTQVGSNLLGRFFVRW